MAVLANLAPQVSIRLSQPARMVKASLFALAGVALGRIAAAAGKSAKLLQFTVPPTRAKLPIGGVEGYTHCGFDKTQSAAVWEALRGWVETGVRPPAVLPG